jgi:penicillin-binding protein 1A
MLSVLTTIVGLLGGLGSAVMDVPDHRALAYHEPPTTTRLYAADGELIREYYRENRVHVTLDEVPPYLVQAFISAEDQDFRDHIGISMAGLARAAVVNLRNAASDRRLHGGSTITQQLAKNLLLTNEVSLLRKAREIVLALRIEEDFTKDEILEMYLNEIYLGRGSYGVAAASLRYFGVAPADLTLSQAAFLAALPKAPNNYHPLFRYDAAVARRNYVLDRMVEDGAITEDEAEAARAEPIEVREQAAPETVSAPYFAEEVRRFLMRTYGGDMVYEGGLAVRTTLDPALQEMAETALREGLIAYDRRHGWRGPIENMALIVTRQQEIEAAAEAEAEPGGADAPAPGEDADAEESGGGGLFGGLARLREGLSGGGAEGAVEPSAEPAEEAAAPLWQTVLAEIDPPAGAGDWRLAVVLEVEPRAVRVGLDDGEIGEIPFTELRWAREHRTAEWLGPPVQSASDVLAVGDVVLVEPVDAVSPEFAAANDRVRRFGLRQVPDVQGAIVVIDPQTGAVRAMAGGYYYGMSEFNRATQAYRQPGSAFKPFVYLAALENGYTPSSMLLDVPVEVEQGIWNPTWRPQNYGGRFQGAMPLRIGVERSRNVMTVRLLIEMGIGPVAEVANRFGIYDDMPHLPAMALGAGETTLMRLTAGYAMIANGGWRIEPFLIDRIQDRHGRTIYRSDLRRCQGCRAEAYAGGPPPQPMDAREAVTDPATAYQMVSILRGVVQRGTAARLSPLGLTLAGKTGTTNDARDTWFVGFSPSLAAGVFVGFDSPRTLGNESGSSAAVPIFGAFMEDALQGVPQRDFPVPPGITTAWVDRRTGHRAGPGSDGAILEVFREGTVPEAAPERGVFSETAERALQGTGGLY